MKKFLLTTVTIAALATPASAADFGARTPCCSGPPAYTAPIYNWTAFYIGGHVGDAFASDNNFSGLATTNNGNGRFLAGMQAGAYRQFAPNWVVGAEAEFSWLTGKG